MKIKLISIVALIAAGLITLAMVVSAQQAKENEYNTNLALARANVEKGIPYNAYHYYEKAFAIRCESEDMFKEYLAQAEALGDDFYEKALTQYLEKYPASVEANERTCVRYYEMGSYRKVIECALAARNNNAASDKVRDLYNECAYMLVNVKAGLTEAQSFLGSTARVKVGELYGYINTSGAFFLAPLYEGAAPFLSGSTAVHEENEWHIINTGGYTIARTDKPVDFMGIPVGDKVAVSVGDKWGYMNSDMVVPSQLPYDYAGTIKNGVAAVKKGDKWALIRADETAITDYIFEDVLLDEFDACCNGGVIFAKQKGKYYMLNTEGSKIIEQGFDDAQPFAGSEPAAVCIDSKWGFVDSAGNQVMKPQFEDARSFSLGLAGVCVDGKWGYITTSGTVRIGYQFDDCKPFTSNGIAAVKENEQWRYVQLLPYTD